MGKGRNLDRRDKLFGKSDVRKQRVCRKLDRSQRAGRNTVSTPLRRHIDTVGWISCCKADNRLRDKAIYKHVPSNSKFSRTICRNSISDCRIEAIWRERCRSDTHSAPFEGKVDMDLNGERMIHRSLFEPLQVGLFFYVRMQTASIYSQPSDLPGWHKRRHRWPQSGSRNFSHSSPEVKRSRLYALQVHVHVQFAVFEVKDRPQEESGLFFSLIFFP